MGMGLLSALIAGALVMTETRASLLALGASCISMAALRGLGKRGLLVLTIAVTLVLGVGITSILRGRGVGVLDLNDQSTTWRLTVWQEGLGLLARHPLVGIGPDAANKMWQEWGLFRRGDQQLPPGHWHSTPLQIAVDRGIPAAFAWLAFMWIFFVTIGRHIRSLMYREGTEGDWRETATVLGAWGGVIGFTLSSTVHYNWGDSEVVMIVWALMGIAFASRGLYRDAPLSINTTDDPPASEERVVGLQEAK